MKVRNGRKERREEVVRLQRRWSRRAFFGCTRSKWLCRRLSLRGPAWDDQWWWRGHGPVSRCWTQLSIKALCPMGWQGWALILLKEKKRERRGEAKRSEAVERQEREIRQGEMRKDQRKTLTGRELFIIYSGNVLKSFNSRKTKPNRWLCNLVKFASFVTGSENCSHSLFNLGFTMEPLGNKIFDDPRLSRQYDTVWTCYLTARKAHMSHTLAI